MAALDRAPTLRPAFTAADRALVQAVHATLQQIGFEAVLVVDPEQGEVVYVGAEVGEVHWRAARTRGGNSVDLMNIANDFADFAGDQSVATLMDAFLAMTDRMRSVLAEVAALGAPVAARAA
jgi:hypothetical protein